MKSTLLPFAIFAVLAVTPMASAKLMVTVDDQGQGGDPTNIQGVQGTTVTGSVLVSPINPADPVPDMTNASLGFQLVPVGGAGVANFSSFAADPTLWNTPTNTLVENTSTLPPTPGPTTYAVGITNLGTGRAPVTGDGVLLTFSVDIPASAANGDTWNIVLGPTPNFANFDTVSDSLAQAFTVLGGTVTAVPEPSAFLFLGLCCGGLALRRRKKK